MVTIDGTQWNYKDMTVIQLISVECLENGRGKGRGKIISRDLETENL